MSTLLLHATAGRAALTAWMDRSGVGVCELARLLNRSHVAVSKWRSGHYRPSEVERAKLQRLSSGEVAALLWLTDAERAEIDAMQPHSAAA